MSTGIEVLFSVRNLFQVSENQKILERNLTFVVHYRNLNPTNLEYFFIELLKRVFFDFFGTLTFFGLFLRQTSFLEFFARKKYTHVQ